MADLRYGIRGTGPGPEGCPENFTAEHQLVSAQPPASAHVNEERHHLLAFWNDVDQASDR
jgi:hypothetical protein